MPRLKSPRLASTLESRVWSRLTAWQVVSEWSPSGWRCHQTSAKQKSRRRSHRLRPVSPSSCCSLLLLPAAAPAAAASSLLPAPCSSVLWAFDRRLSNSPCNLHTLKTVGGAGQGRAGRAVSGFWCNVCWLWAKAPLLRRNPLTD